MTYKTLVVHVDRAAENRVMLAADLARRHDAVLIGVAAGMWQPPIALIGPNIGAMTSEIIEAGREQVEADLKVSAVLFEKLTSRKGIETEWRSRLDFPGNALTNAASAADLVIVGSMEEYTVGSEYRSVNPGDVLMSAGRPVLIAPGAIGDLDARNIVAAWKNTREARRALGDAVPVLARAESVVLLQVKEQGEETETIVDAESFLKRHGVVVSKEIRDLKEPTVADELRQYARDVEADLIVAGGYGRSRLREWVFGGVTRGLLSDDSIACMLSH